MAGMRSDACPEGRSAFSTRWRLTLEREVSIPCFAPFAASNRRTWVSHRQSMLSAAPMVRPRQPIASRPAPAGSSEIDNARRLRAGAREGERCGRRTTARSRSKVTEVRGARRAPHLEFTTIATCRNEMLRAGDASGRVAARDSTLRIYAAAPPRTSRSHNR
jgi:hypothetical protein